ncbi:hypothetical protein Tco_0601471 [Tanacetum coccineum]
MLDELMEQSVKLGIAKLSLLSCEEKEMGLECSEQTTFENAFNSEFKEYVQKYTRFDAQSLYDAMICNMDSIGKYMLEITLHQQRTPQLLKQKKLMQTQEDHSNPIPAINVDSLKVNFVVIQNTCSEKEDSNSETASSKSVKESNLNSETKDVHAIKYKMSKAKTQESKIDTGKAVDNGLVVMESNGIESTVQDDNSRSGNDTDTDDADIRPIYDKEPMAEIQEKVFAIAALKNDLRKLKGNSVDTKFDKTSVLGKPVLQSPRNQSVVRQPNAFKSERPKMSKQRFASQVDVNNNLSKSVTQHYLPKKREFVFTKPDHMIASSESRNSSKNMPIFSSNDMVHNHYLDEAKKKTQERDRNSKTSVTHSARFKSTADDSKLKPRNNNQTPRSLHVSKSSCVTITVVPKADHSKSSSSFSDSKNFVCSTCHKCVFNANHDACITKLLKEVNSRVKTQSHKTRNSNKPEDQKNHTQKPARQIFTGYRFSPNKTSAVYEKTSPRSDLRWKPMGRIFKSVGLRWIPTGKLFDSCTSKDDSEPTLGLNVDISNIHESKQTLDLSACTSINVQKEQSLSLSAVYSVLCSTNNSNGENQVVSKYSTVTTADASDKRQQQPDSASSTSTLATSVTVDGNFDF